MADIDRRSFLVGLFGTAAVIAAGPIPKALTETAFDVEAWVKAISKVYGEHISNALIYGSSAIRFTETWPYAKVISPAEMTETELAACCNREEILPVTDELSSARKLLSDEIGRRAIRKTVAEDKARRHTTGEL